MFNRFRFRHRRGKLNNVKTRTVPVFTIERIVNRIFTIRNQKVILDKDLAFIYGVKPIRLREQVKRNIKRFPNDFMFRLNNQELELVVSQFAIPSRKYFGGSMPYVFTEHGAVMLASVLNSPRAIEMSIFVVRAFIKMREMLSSYKALFESIKELERQVKGHDEKIEIIFQALKELIEPDNKPVKKIGF
ncbi:MAG: ORF6N domain-containing protein [Candidatus Hydrogenedentota bacterium]